MKIVFVTPELAPIAKVGGLADVAASLPRAIRRLGHEVSVLTPRYGALEGLRLKRVGESVALGRVHGVPTYFLEHAAYFAERAVYGELGADHADNALRFGHFSRAAVEAIDGLGLAPDVLHVHDWPTALVPVFAAGRFPTVLTIHNLAYQGVFPESVLSELGLPQVLFHVDGVEFYGQVNFLKGGMMTADALTTVSPSYAEEIQTETFGAGLDGVARHRSEDLVGILNGIELETWHPGKDPALPAPFASNRLTGKAACKQALQAELGLTVAPERPLLGVVGRLDAQKGFDLLLEATPALMERGAQLALLGSGNLEYLEAFKRIRSRYPGSLAAEKGFNDPLGRRIYAGSDFFLMPSRYEPCGLGQMIALRYGTLPIVRATGGLRDTIRDLDEDPEGGNGFRFDDFSSDALLAAVARALRWFEDPKRLRRAAARGMREDSSWKTSAKRYVDVYERALAKHAGS